MGRWEAAPEPILLNRQARESFDMGSPMPIGI